MSKLQDNIIHFFEGNFTQQTGDFPEYIKDIKKTAFEKFKSKGFPTLRDEKWRKTKLTGFTQQYFHPSLSEITGSKSLVDTCIVPELKTENIALVNGKFVADYELKILDNGVVLGSLSKAMEVYPDVVYQYFNRLAHDHDNSFNHLNTALFSDGLFLYVPSQVKDFNLQITHRLDGRVDSLINTRNLIILKPGSKVNMIQCDDSNEHRSHFATFNTEVYVGEKSELYWYKYQNINNVSALFSQQFAKVETGGKFYTNFFELNGKLLRNEQFTDIVGKDVSVNHYGLYLADKVQQFDNVIFITHSSEGSYSNQKFKGILDDSAHSFFNGQILVKKEAQQTNAYQKNDNILLTDKARISSQPFLEIYADDVSCSHGSTTGQLDNEALFYIRQRGISKRDAQLLQLYAFAGEVIETVQIPELIEPTKDLVKKRLNGELDACENCILQCAVKE